MQASRQAAAQQGQVGRADMQASRQANQAANREDWQSYGQQRQQSRQSYAQQRQENRTVTMAIAEANSV
jgi:hypothetical protein